ncbi:MAG: HNH endonuclease [Pseudobacteriovorax sp.]|nr:HNH endonuclease [Pseudobacteriovorax sp.]
MSLFAKTYHRSDFGHGWDDQDRDCQDTRAELLIKRSLAEVSFKRSKQKGKSSCVVAKGEWYDEYSGKTFNRASKVDVDHVVPLKFAFEHGAKSWSKERRITFSNDTDNLVITDKRLNRQKGAKGPHQWLPARDKCGYLKRWQAILDKYQLEGTVVLKALFPKHCKTEESLTLVMAFRAFCKDKDRLPFHEAVGCQIGEAILRF